MSFSSAFPSSLLTRAFADIAPAARLIWKKKPSKGQESIFIFKSEPVEGIYVSSARQHFLEQKQRER